MKKLLNIIIVALIGQPSFIGGPKVAKSGADCCLDKSLCSNCAENTTHCGSERSGCATCD